MKILLRYHDTVSLMMMILTHQPSGVGVGGQGVFTKERTNFFLVNGLSAVRVRKDLPCLFRRAEETFSLLYNELVCFAFASIFLFSTDR